MFSLLCLFSCFMSIMFLCSKMPLALTVYLSLNAIFVAVIMLSYMKSSWFSFILMMVFLSGMMVIFTYVSSLSSNEFTSSMFSPFMMILTFMIMMFMLITMKAQNSQILISSNNLVLSLSQAIYLHKLYEKDSIFIMTMMITYLLIALLVVVKNSSLDQAPLRSTIN